MSFAQIVSEWLYARKHASCQDAVEYHYNDLPLPRTKRYKGKLYYIDPVSRKRRLPTPEEKVRQRIILFLHYDLGIPYDAMAIEISLGRFWKRATGRMDIAVYSKDPQQKRPILVVECKAEHILLTEHVFRQVDNYAAALNIPFVAITNGHKFSMDYWDNNTHTYHTMRQIPSYAQLCTLVKEGMGEQSALDRIDAEDVKYREALREGILGAQTPHPLADVLVALHHCWMDNDKRCTAVGGLTDCGTYQNERLHSDGSLHGFRHFCGTDDNQQPVCAYLCIRAPKIPNIKKGPTNLEVYLGDVTKSPALRLRTEKFMIVDGNCVHLWHDGHLNVGGKLGAVPRKAVIDFLRQQAPDLIDQAGNVDLGTFSITPVRMDESGMADVCSRLIRYALIRSKYCQNLRSDLKNTIGK